MSFDIMKGLATTLKNMGRKPTTVSFPEQERELPPRFRGRHVLHRYENGLERCVACYLCAAACPADVIYIEAEENTAEHRVSPGERYAKTFDINLLRCIFCGYCQAACPTGAITLEQEYKLVASSPEELIYHKEQLLEPLGQATVGTNADWYERPPADAAQPIPQRHHVFDGSEANAASVGMGDLATERPILLVNEEQDKDRRNLADEEEDGQQR
jgi:NADH-quinone oxidoreductase subunit I